MKNFLKILFLCWGIGSVFAQNEYWLLEQDFVKMGKKELYENQKTAWVKKQSYPIFAIADLENPQFLFLMPLKNISSLGSYPPLLNQLQDPLIETCLNFQVFSLFQLLDVSPGRPNELFTEDKPYYFYVVYDMTLDAKESLEQAFAKVKSSGKFSNGCLWKGLLSGDCPKYVFCISFKNKEEMTDWSMEKMLDEGAFKSGLRDKKTGWMRKQVNLCIE